MEVILVTGRTIGQGLALEDKFSPEYKKEVAVCELSQHDMEREGIKDGDVIKVSTPEREVYVFAKASEKLDKGIAFMPLGPWVNMLIPSRTDSVGMPNFKGIRARIELAIGKEVLDAEEILRRYMSEG